MTKGNIVTDFQKLDNVIFTLTGKRVKQILPKAVEYFGTMAAEKFLRDAQEAIDPESPYKVLGVRSDADDFIIEAVYKNLAKLYHPDNLVQGNEARFKEIQAAYDKIQEMRNQM